MLVEADGESPPDAGVEGVGGITDHLGDCDCSAQGYVPEQLGVVHVADE